MAKNKPAKKSPRTKNIVIAAAALLITALAVVAFQMRSSTDQPSDSRIDEFSMRKGETRETLPPSMFADPFIAEMYQVAKDIPHILDSVKCYCYCDRDPFYHVSLLSCYVDKHAAG